jgi:hypothetical protein
VVERLQFRETYQFLKQSVKVLIAMAVIAALPGYSRTARSKPDSPVLPTVTVTGQIAGPTPFIVLLQLSANPVGAVRSISFEIVPKLGSVTRPLSATYYREYLASRGWIDSATGQINVPVFGLYANYANTVNLTYCFNDGSSQQASVMVPTAQFSDPCGYGHGIILQPRIPSTDLSYDYMFVKDYCSTYSPTILDTDGEIRWVGTAGVKSYSSIFYQNGVYIASATTLMRMEFDGAVTLLGDYGSLGISGFEHNIDYGKQGIILDADTRSQTQSFNIEMDGAGNVLKTWDLASIISAAMTAGGDDPGQFIQPSPTDWFHANAVAYRSSDHSLLVSSRENFVIAIDYETGAIKWILGDPTKKWYQFPSLRQYALTLGPSTLPPIGQHAVSITLDDNLLLLDDGQNSLYQMPAGTNRTYSTARKYHIDTQAKTATELWNDGNQTLKSPYCSSVYEDHSLNYLVDYAMIGGDNPTGGGEGLAELFGLTASGVKVFDYVYPTTACQTSWNAMPIHLEGMAFTGGDVLNPTGGWQITSVVRNGSNAIVSFPAVSGRTYRLEYKNQLSDAAWSPVTDYTVSSACSDAQIADPSAASQPRRFYRVRLLSQ